MEVAAAVAKAGQAIRMRISRCVAENATVADRNGCLGTELQEVEAHNARLSRALECGSQEIDSESDKALRQEDIDASAHLAKMQVAASAAAEAAAQSAEAVGVAEEEVASLMERLAQARAECAEKSNTLTLVAENLERYRAERRRTESELDVVVQEVAKLECARLANGRETLDSWLATPDRLHVGADALGSLTHVPDCEADPWIARERRTETVPREQMLLLQHLRGSQRGGAGAGNAGSSALEALRDLREQQVLQASALSTEEKLLCAELQRNIQASLLEMQRNEETLRLELDRVNRDRDLLLSKLDNDKAARSPIEKPSDLSTLTLNVTQEAKDAVDDGTITRMSVVMGDAQKFLDEQKQRIDDVEQERDEIRSRLLDILIRLEGPEYATMVVDTAVHAAAKERSTAILGVEGPVEDASDIETQWLASRRSLSPAPWQPPPTIVEEED